MRLFKNEYITRVQSKKHRHLEKWLLFLNSLHNIKLITKMDAENFGLPVASL